MIETLSLHVEQYKPTTLVYMDNILYNFSVAMSWYRFSVGHQSSQLGP